MAWLEFFPRRRIISERRWLVPLDLFIFFLLFFSSFVVLCPPLVCGLTLCKSFIFLRFKFKTETLHNDVKWKQNSFVSLILTLLFSYLFEYFASYMLVCYFTTHFIAMLLMMLLCLLFDYFATLLLTLLQCYLIC